MPAIRQRDEARADSSGVVLRPFPPARVALQLRIYAPIGTAIKNELSITKTRIASGIAW